MTRELSSRPPEPLKPAAEWLRGVRPGWIPSSNVSLAVAGRALFDYEPETGATYIVTAAAYKATVGRGRHVGAILFNPMADLLSDRALRGTLAHEILHMVGTLNEDEVDRVVEEAARLEPGLFATRSELDAEVGEKLQPLVEGVDIWSEYVLPPQTRVVVYVIGEPRPSYLFMVSASLPIISCAGG
ncbi:MAG: hypothetical protein QXT37_08345 [Thermofilaceae archaeon]